MHAEQEVAPVSDMKYPKRQFEQLEDDADEENDPLKQLEQKDAEATENEPAAQAPDTAVRPVVAQ